MSERIWSEDERYVEIPAHGTDAWRNQVEHLAQVIADHTTSPYVPGRSVSESHRQLACIMLESLKGQVRSYATVTPEAVEIDDVM